MMKDILNKLAELEATAPKVTKKKMLKEDSTTAPINVSNKPASLKDVFAALSESIPPGQKPLPVMDPTNKKAGMGFVTSSNPSVQNILKNLDPKDVQIVQAPGQATAAGQPAPAGATGQAQPGQMQMKEKDEGKPGKNFAKIAKSAGERYGSKAAGERVAGAVRAKLAKQGKLEEEQLDELSPELMKRYARGRRDQLSNVAQAHDMRTTGQTNPKTSITKDKISGYYDAQAGDIGKARVAVGQQPTDAAGQAKSARMSQDLDSQAAFNAQRKHKALKGHDALIKTVGKLRDTGAIKEGAKVDRMVKHIEKSEKKLGKSKGGAEDIAWATANKRGMLDNKNKKAVKEGFYSVRSNNLKQELEKNGWERIPGREVPDNAKYGYRKNGVGRFYKVMDEPYHSFDVSFVKPRRVIDKLVPLDTLLELIRGSSVTEGDIPSSSGVDTKGAGLGAGRSATTLESKEPQVEVIDNAFNRENYKDLIGKKYPKSKAPSYARVKEVTEGKKGVNPFPKKDDNASTKAPAKGKKPDFLDLDKDGDKKEPMKKAAADKKKQKVKESMNHRISAARLEGKSHGLRGHAHSGKRYEDLDEMKAYHEGYKEGLDECYGQGVYEGLAGTAGGAIAGGMLGGPLGAVAGGLLGSELSKESAPATPPATVSGMADDAMDEGNAFTAALAKTPKGGKFEVGGKTFTDRSNYGENVNEYAFESLDQQLNALLNESEDVNEGLSVSISKGQQNSPDSVTITAQDQEAEHLLAFVKNAGLGLFGDDNADTHSSAMSVQPSHGAPDEIGAGGAEIGVVDGHDGMMGLMQKLSGIQSGGAEDYADEEGDEEHLYGNHQAAGKKDCGCDGDCECSDYDQPSNEASCKECGTYEGMHEAGCSMGRGKEMVDEVESEDQMEFEVAEANAPDTGEAESTADENAEAAEDAALAKSDMQNKTDTVNEGGDGGEASEEGPESKEGETDEEGETVSESFANLFRKLAFIAEESTEKEDDKAEKAGKKVAKDIEYDENHKGKDDDKAEKAGKKVTKDIEYDDKKDKKEKVDEWANNAGPGKTVSDTTFEQDIDFMTKVIAGGLNKPKSTGQTTIPVIAGQDDRMHDSPKDWATLAGIKK